MATTGGFAKGGAGGAEFQILVPLSKFARSLASARTLASRSVRGMGRVITATMARAWAMAAAATRIFTRSLAMVRRAITRTLGLITGLFAPLGAIGAGMGGAAIFGFAAYQFATFEQKMAKVKAVSGATSLEFERLTAFARQLGRSTEFSAQQAAEAMGNFSVAGFSVKEILAAMEPTLALASAGQLDMATSSDIVAKTMRGMGLDASELTRAVDVMANAFTTSNTDLVMLGDAFRYVGPVGKAAGKSLEEMTAAIQVMSDAGIQGQQAGTALRNILLRLQAQPKEVERALKSMGVEIEDSDGNMRHLADIIEDVGVASQKMTGVQRGATFAALAGTRAAAAFNAIVDKGADSLREKEKALKKSGTAADIQKIRLDTLAGSFKILLSAISDVAIELGSLMAPALRKIAEGLTAIMPTVSRLTAAVKPLFTLLGERLTAAFRTLDIFLQRNIETFKGWGVALTQILQSVGDNVRQLIKWFLGLFGITEGEAVQGITDKITIALNKVGAVLTDPLKALGALADVIEAGFWKGVAGMVGGLRGAFSWLVGTLIGTFKTAWDLLSTVLIETFKIIAANVKGALTPGGMSYEAKLKRYEEVEEPARGEIKEALAGFGGALQYNIAAASGTANELAKSFTGAMEESFALSGERAMGRAKKTMKDLEDARSKAQQDIIKKNTKKKKYSPYLDPFIAPWRVTMGLAKGPDPFAETTKTKDGGVLADAGKKNMEGAGERMGISEYLAGLQKSVFKQDKDKTEQNTAAIAESVTEGGDLHSAIKNVGGAAAAFG